MAGEDSSRLNKYSDIRSNIQVAGEDSSQLNKYLDTRNNIQAARVPAPPIISYAQNIKEKLIQELFWRR